MKKNHDNYHPPAFQFYPSDYLSDEKVQSMSIEGEGVYIRLLSYNWREGSIPSNRLAIARLCKGYDGPGIDEALGCFIPTAEDERLTNPRLEEERKKQIDYHNSRKNDGLCGAKKRWASHRVAIADVIAPPIANHSSSSSSLSSLKSCIVEIIEYLNMKTGKKFKPETDSTARMITSRLKKGRTVDEFKRVIDNKCSTWLNDPKMHEFLRPETLFTDAHFESYLNEGGLRSADEERARKIAELELKA